jgi:exodeoxyribonuclease-5
VIVVDEASMVNDQTVADLLALDIPILAMGNAAQLPPVSGAGSLTAGEPDAFLTEIHRQAQGNPIVQLSMLAREGRPLRRGIYGDSHVVGLTIDAVARSKADQILCGRPARGLI